MTVDTRRLVGCYSFITPDSLIMMLDEYIHCLSQTSCKVWLTSQLSVLSSLFLIVHTCNSSIEPLFGGS
jgi:hypothetical protein